MSRCLRHFAAARYAIAADTLIDACAFAAPLLMADMPLPPPLTMSRYYAP